MTSTLGVKGNHHTAVKHVIHMEQHEQKTAATDYATAGSLQRPEP